MKFAHINARDRTIRLIDCADLGAALKVAGLQEGKLDYGMVASDTGIAVFEFSLTENPKQQSYFCTGRDLYGGSALLFGVGDGGETVDLGDEDAVGLRGRLRIQFFDASEAEAQINAGRIIRPVIALNGETLWSWPNALKREEAAT